MSNYHIMCDRINCEFHREDNTCNYDGSQLVITDEGCKTFEPKDEGVCMKTFIITFEATGGIVVQANSEEEALAIFDKVDDRELLKELEANGIKVTDCFEEK